MSDAPWDLIDASLIRMRRVLEMPKHAATEGVDLSAVLVVDAIARRTDNGETTRIADIAAHLSVAPSTASRLVASTEAAGYIRRARRQDDPRCVTLHLTSSGGELAAAATQFRVSLLRRVTVGWESESIDTFAQLLDDFSRALPEFAYPNR